MNAPFYRDPSKMAPISTNPQERANHYHKALTNDNEASHCNAYTLIARQYLIQGLPTGTTLPLTLQQVSNLYGHMDTAITAFITNECAGFETHLAVSLASESKHGAPEELWLAGKERR